MDTTFHGGLEQVLLCNLVNFVLGGLQLAGVILLCSVAAAIPDSMWLHCLARKDKSQISKPHKAERRRPYSCCIVPVQRTSPWPEYGSKESQKYDCSSGLGFRVVVLVRPSESRSLSKAKGIASGVHGCLGSVFFAVGPLGACRLACSYSFGVAGVCL